MPYTVRLCRDRSGWFATRDGVVPQELVRWSETFADAAQAVRVLDVAALIAQRLTRREYTEKLDGLIAGPARFG